jgi:hypothetical protein
MTAWQRQGVFAYALFGLVVLGAVVYALRSGSVEVPLRYLQITLQRRSAPVRYWLVISLYFIVAIGFFIAAWRVVSQENV